MMPAAGEEAPGEATRPLHLLKMAVGVASLDELRQLRAQRIKRLGGSWVYTRNHPRRAEAVLAGGSLYWVIRAQIRVRQRITGFRSERDEEGRGFLLPQVRPVVGPPGWPPSPALHGPPLPSLRPPLLARLR